MWGRTRLAVVVVAFGILGYLWAQRDVAEPRPRVPDPQVVTIVSVGDILLGDAAEGVLSQKGYGFPFQHVRLLLGGADILMGNLEGPVTARDTPLDSTKAYTYRQHPDAAEALANEGFDALAVGNNHALDHGSGGLSDTIDHLERSGIATFGAGHNAAEARRGVVLTRKGVRIGLLSYLQPYDSYEKLGWYASDAAPGVARLDVDQVEQDVRRLRAEADIVIVHAHFGSNYQPVSPYQREVARRIIDAGADAVNGHHPHVAQGMDVHDGKPILYSLGNFVFGTPGRFGEGDAGYGIVARYNVSVPEKRIVSVEVDLISTNNRRVRFQPRPVGLSEARRAWTDISIGFSAIHRWEGSTAVVQLRH